MDTNLKKFMYLIDRNLGLHCRPFFLFYYGETNMNDIMPNRKISAGPLRTIISYTYNDDDDPDWGYYVVQIEVWDGSRLIRKERIVTDNLNISDESMED